MSRKCNYCGKILSEEIHSQSTYCNKTCKNKARWLRRGDKVKIKQKIRRIEKRLKQPEKYCLQCGKLIDKLAHPNRKYCSCKCSNKYFIYHGKSKINIDKDSIYKKYITEEYSAMDISKMFKCSHSTITNILKRFGITARITGIDPHTKRVKQKCSLSAKKQLKEVGHPRLGMTNSKEQKRKYLETRIMRNNLPKKEKNPMWGKYHSKETRLKISKTNKDIGWALEKNPNWKGGISFEPYDKKFNKRFKNFIIKRDNYICLFCGINNESAKRKYTQGLHIHHIDYDKMNTSKENCCALCCKCNIKANYNRCQWTKFYHFLLSFRYGYSYPELNVTFEGQERKGIHSPIISEELWRQVNEKA